jgi:hypothetical protein
MSLPESRFGVLSMLISGEEEVNGSEGPFQIHPGSIDGLSRRTNSDTDEGVPVEAAAGDRDAE